MMPDEALVRVPVASVERLTDPVACTAIESLLMMVAPPRRKRLPSTQLMRLLLVRVLVCTPEICEKFTVPLLLAVTPMTEETVTVTTPLIVKVPAPDNV